MSEKKSDGGSGELSSVEKSIEGIMDLRGSQDAPSPPKNPAIRQSKGRSEPSSD